MVKDQLEKADCNILGVILNKAEQKKAAVTALITDRPTVPSTGNCVLSPAGTTAKKMKKLSEVSDLKLLK